MISLLIFTSTTTQNNKTMTTQELINKNSENLLKIESLKIIKETQWVGETTHDTLDKCLTAINVFCGTNSGWYSPKPIRINGVQGIFMLNQDGGINFESRVIKVSDKKFRIEHLTNSGFESFEKKYLELLG